MRVSTGANKRTALSTAKASAVRVTRNLEGMRDSLPSRGLDANRPSCVYPPGRGGLLPWAGIPRSFGVARRVLSIDIEAGPAVLHLAVVHPGAAPRTRRLDAANRFHSRGLSNPVFCPPHPLHPLHLPRSPLR